MGEMTIFEYARMASQAEQRVIELFELPSREDPEAETKVEVLHKNAPAHQGKESSG